MGLMRLENEQNRFFFDKKSFIILVCICMIVFSIYCFSIKLVDNNTGRVIVDVSDLTLSINNQMPLSDKSGMSLDITDLDEGIIDEISFSVTADGDAKYDIYVTSDDSDLKYVKIYLTDGAGVPLPDYKKNVIPTYSSLRSLNDLPEGLSLYSGKLLDGDTKNFKLRIWLSDSYPMTLNKTDFIIKINVRTSL